MTIAIIGRGSMGAAHARAYARLGLGGEVRYVVATTSDGGLEDAPGAEVVTDVRRALDDPAVEVVSVCTPTTTHLEYALAALEAGKHVLLEKPMALRAEDARRIAAAAAEAPTVLMVAQVVRFFAGYRRVRKAIDANRIGQVVAVRAHRMIGAPPAGWWWDAERSGGPVVDLGVHDFDQLGCYLGEPVAVRAVGVQAAAGPIETTVEYAGGGIGQVLSYAAAPAFATSLEVVGDAGVAEFRFNSTVGNITDDGAAPAAGEFRLRSATESIVEPVHDDDPYTEQARYFLECVRNRASPEYCPLASSLDATLTALGARDSLARGGERIAL